MKILFIWFNFRCQSFGMNVGVSILSKELQDAGHCVKIIHLSEYLGYDFDIDKIVDDANSFQPDIFALSFGSNHYIYAVNLADHLKKYFPDKLIICGGIHSTLDPEQVIGNRSIDIVCIGEVDGGHFVKFVERLETGKDYNEFPNFWVKQNNIIYRNKLSYLPDIKNQTFLNFKSIDYKKITKLKRGIVDIFSSRGCPYKCSYCQNHAIYRLYTKNLGKIRYFRQRSVKNLIEELELFLDVVGKEAKGINFCDDVFILNKNWIKEFSNSYKQVTTLPFYCTGLVNFIDEEVGEYLAYANCNMVRFGIETYSDKTRLEILNKPFKNVHFEKTIDILRARNINITGYVMIGIPGETEKDILNTFKYCSKLKLDCVRCMILYPYKNTKIYEYCSKEGLIEEKEEIISYHFGTKLKWNKNLKLFIEKANSIFPLILNTYLKNSMSFEFKKIVSKVFEMDEKEFIDIKLRNWIQEKLMELSLELKKRGEEHYFLPFSDRPDMTFLYRKRPRKLVNIDN